MGENRVNTVRVDIAVVGTKFDRELHANFDSVDDAHNAVEEFFEHYAPHP